MADRQNAPEQRTIDVDVESIDTRGRTLHGYAAVYGVESDDLGGFRERIAPGAFGSVLDADVRALLNHDPNSVLGRSKSGTLRLFDEQRGLRFEVDLPNSPLGENVREAVARGDIDGASFRSVVGDEEWDGDLRTVQTVKELHDVTVATYGAYPAASVELRTRADNNEPARREKDTDMDIEGSEERTNEGGLQVEDRVTEPEARRGLADEFRAAGFPGETATIPWQAFEDRAITWTGSVDNVAKVRTNAVDLGYDQRYAWPAFPRVAVDEGVTSVDVFTQTARSLATAANVVRAVDAVTNKPETGSTLTIVTTAMKQVATVQSGIPNVYLESPTFNSVIESDLRLALNDGLDKLILDAIAASGFQAPGTDPLLVSIRKAMTTIQGNGYNPDTLILTPANAEALDVLVFRHHRRYERLRVRSGQLRPQPDLWAQQADLQDDPRRRGGGLERAWEAVRQPGVVGRFEENAGKTNTSLVRLETHAVFGVERQNAAVRIAAA